MKQNKKLKIEKAFIRTQHKSHSDLQGEVESQARPSTTQHLCHFVVKLYTTCFTDSTAVTLAQSTGRVHVRASLTRLAART